MNMMMMMVVILQGNIASEFQFNSTLPGFIHNF